MNIQQLNTDEKIQLAEQLWESVRVEAGNSELTSLECQELDKRLLAMELDGELGQSWDVVKQRILFG